MLRHPLEGKGLQEPHVRWLRLSLDGDPLSGRSGTTTRPNRTDNPSTVASESFLWDQRQMSDIVRALTAPALPVLRYHTTAQD